MVTMELIPLKLFTLTFSSTNIVRCTDSSNKPAEIADKNWPVEGRLYGVDNIVNTNTGMALVLFDIQTGIEYYKGYSGDRFEPYPYKYN